MTPRNGIRSARFWVWANGSPCKLTLQPGGSAFHRERGVTDDGRPGATAVRWTLSETGEGVTCLVDARSDDGVLSADEAHWCPITQLRAHTYVNTGRIAPVEELRVDIPNWRRMYCKLRDRTKRRPGIPLRT